jgi:hypothetical protein
MQGNVTFESTEDELSLFSEDKEYSEISGQMPRVFQSDRNYESWLRRLQGVQRVHAGIATPTSLSLVAV